MLAMNVLCTASETAIDVLHLVQSLASGSATQHHLGEDRGIPMNQQPSTSKSTRDCSAKHSAAITPTDNRQADLKKGTRFTLPASAEKSVSQAKSSKLSRQESADKMSHNKKSMKTLNVLGMQPDFSESLAGSVGQTLTYSGTADNDSLTVSASKQTAEEVEYQRNERSRSETVQSVRTQSLIENESIPETLPSQYSSNTTVLGFGSSTTLEAGISTTKSGGLLATSNSYSKNLDLSISNVLSTAIISSNPSGDIPTIGEEQDSSVSSIIPVQRKLVSPISGLLADYGQPSNLKHNSQDLPTLREVASLQGSNRDSGTRQINPISPQGVDSQCTHYTHSTAPLSGGAGVPGSQVPPSTIYRRSALSTPATELPIIESRCSTALGDTSKFESWPNEVALVYTLNMASVVIFGKSSLIQKVALEGLEQDGPSQKDQVPPHQKHGLIQLVEFTGEAGSESDPTRCGK